MLYSQLDEIIRKINNEEDRLLNEYENGQDQETILHHKFIYGYDETIRFYHDGYKVIESFYEQHKETSPTRAECREGIAFLETYYEKMDAFDDDIKTLIVWFIESYGDIPEKEIFLDMFEKSHDDPMGLYDDEDLSDEDEEEYDMGMYEEEDVYINKNKNKDHGMYYGY